MLNKALAFFLISFLAFSCSRFEKHMPTGPKKEADIFSPLWIKNLDPVYESGNLPIALGSPLIHEGVIYVGNNNNSMSAFHADSGRLIWTEPTVSGFHSAPIVYENILIYGDISGRVYGKDLSSGEFKYQFDLGSSVDSLLTVKNGRLFIHTRNHKIFSIDALTGKVLWSYKRSIPFFSTLQRTSTPLVVENRVYVGFADGYLLAFSLEEGQVVWERKLSSGDKFVDVDMSPIYYREKLIVGSINGQVEVIDPQSGAVFKRLDFTTNRDAFYFDDKLLLGTTDGRIVVVDSSFDVVKDISVSKTGISSITGWKNGLVVSTVGKNIYYLDREFKIVSKFDLGTSNSAVFGLLSVGEDKLALMSSRNRLYLFK